MAANETQCQALQLADAQRCENEATNANGLFCQFHAKQVYGLYKGYKRRNAMLDALEEEVPPALKDSRTPLSNETFESITEETTLREVHSHLFEKYVLLGKVIDARKLHHKHFYSQELDYGHQVYLEKLSSQRHTVLRALGRLEKRTAKVLYQQEQWFTWVRKIQNEEEASGEKEQKKVKQEAALFKRHWKQLEAKLELKRQKEEKQRQDAYLEDAYRERMSMTDDDDDETWDPIEDMAQDNRDRYMDLIKHFLWMDLADAKESDALSRGAESKTGELAQAEEPQPPAKKTKKKSKAKGRAPKPDSSSGAGDSSSDVASNAYVGQERLMAMRMSNHAGGRPNLQEPDKSNIETEEEMRKRLGEGVKKNLDGMGWQLVGTMENPHETFSKTAPMSNDEIESVVEDIREIKVLLFCRLLLAQASMLPAALRATSVSEFLNDVDIAERDLRDLCLKVEKPGLQQIRDACADFARGDEVGEPAKVEVECYENEALEDLLMEDSRYRNLHSHDWFFNAVLKQAEGKGLRKKKKKKKKSKSPNSKVTICGRSIWNHASENAMSRDGWLQFSILAKDCDLKHAIQLCRNWAEFTELNHLTLWQYFPASNWVSWGGDRLVRQLQELGLFPYFTDLDAQKHSRHNQVGGRTRGRRQHDFVEARNVIAAHMKRNDPVTRRFIQYLVMRTGEVLVLVRDGKTGRVITAPPKEHLWTYRKKQGLGRATKSEWENVLEIGPDYFDMTDQLREWRFGFDDYYDIFVWDFVPDQAAIGMYNIVVTELRNAWRITHPRDVYRHMKPLLETLTREKDTMRTRQIKEGEKVESLWETVNDDRNEFKLFDIKGEGVTCRSGADLTKYMFYNEANAAEDAVLFPDEAVSNDENVPFREIRNGISRVEYGHLANSMRSIRKGLQALDEGKNPMDAVNAPDEYSIFALPNIWKTGLEQVHKEGLSKEQRKLLEKAGLTSQQRLDAADEMELMERDRAFEFKDSFHDGDLEPGNTQRYLDIQARLTSLLKVDNSGSTDWVWFLAKILNWLKQRADNDDYAKDPTAPWPHGFIIHDLVQAFVAMAMFFPESNVTTPVTQFLQSDECASLRDSSLFNPKERCKTRPDRRSRTSYKFRNKEFWTEWKKVYAQEAFYADIYPMDWSLAVRPIVAHLYRAGIIAPAYIQNDPYVISGIATANTEPHRPDKLDLFINYEDQYGNFQLEFGPNFVPPSQWPDLLPLARTFAGAHPTARFALLRLWSAAHYYPFMVGLHNRQNTSFLDSTGRSWEWKFVPKDMPASEFSAHRVTSLRLDLLREQFGGRVTNRGDLILVMGEDAADLFKYCTAVTFALQTKPWLREIDLWKSFVNVDLDFIVDLDPFWLD